MIPVLWNPRLLELDRNTYYNAPHCLHEETQAQGEKMSKITLSQKQNSLDPNAPDPKFSVLFFPTLLQ